MRRFPSAFGGREQCGGNQTNVCGAHHAPARDFPIDLDRVGKAGARLRLYHRPSGNRSPATERDSLVRNFRLPPNRTIWALSRRSAFGLLREIPLEAIGILEGPRSRRVAPKLALAGSPRRPRRAEITRISTLRSRLGQGQFRQQHGRLQYSTVSNGLSSRSAARKERGRGRGRSGRGGGIAALQGQSRSHKWRMGARSSGGLLARRDEGA